LTIGPTLVPLLLAGSAPLQPSAPLPPLAAQLVAFEAQLRVVDWPG
jgi:hypothetical protein